MPWKVDSPMSLREEFMIFALRDDANVSALCRRYGISRKTGYKWIARCRREPRASLADRSRRPLRSPGKTSDALEQLITALRIKHPAWGARKLKRRLEDQGHWELPARSTINDILRRGGLIHCAPSAAHTAWKRFERAGSNELWQMDFKGHFATDAQRCHPLTVLDDHSRFNLVLRACSNEQSSTVRAALTDAMRRYGMPRAILSDNGSPWGTCGQESNWTALTLWLIRCGIGILHGQAFHPQTQGKEERFHRTLKAEAIGTRRFKDLPHCQRVFDDWRQVYNHERPHEAIDLATPATRYTPSVRSFPEVLPPIEYGCGDVVRRVCQMGYLSFKGRRIKVGRAYAHQPLALRPTTTEGVMKVFYCHQNVAEIDLRCQSQ